MDEGISRILNNYQPERHPDRNLAREEYRMVLGDLEIGIVERLDDLDAQRRADFVDNWRSHERNRLQRESLQAVSSERDPVQQIAIHEPYLAALRELDDEVNKPYLKNADFIEARLASEQTIADRRNSVEKRFEAAEQALDARFGFREADRQTSGNVTSFLSSVKEHQSRQLEADHEPER